MSLRDLLASFHIDVDDADLKKADANIKGFKETLRDLGAVVAKTFALYEIREFIQSEIEVGAQLGVMATRLGTTTDELQAMQLAAGEAGVSAESLTTGLRFLNRNMAEASKAGGEQAKIFKDLGISLKDADGTARPAGDVMGDLADSIASIPDAAKKTEIAMKLLGRGGAELIPLLSKGGQAFEDARKRMIELGGGMSKEFVESAKKAEEANVDLAFSMKGLKAVIAEQLFPGFTAIVREITHVASEVIAFTKHVDFMSGAFEVFGTIAAFKAIGGLKEIAKVLGVLKPTALETIGALLEFALPIAPIVALYLIANDFFVMMRGGDSVIGRALGPDKKQFIEDMSAAMDDLGAAWDAFKTIAMDVGGVLWEIDEALEPLGTVTSLSDLARDARELALQIKGAVENVLHLIEAAGKLKKLAFLGLDGAPSGSDWGGAFDALKKTTIGRMLTGGPSKVTGFAVGQKFREAAGLPPREAPAPGSYSGSETTGTEAAYARAPRAANFVDLPNWVERAPAYVMPRGGGGAGGEHAGPGEVHFQQTNNFHTEVQTSSDQPKAVGDAVGQGISTPLQRANDKARTNFRKP